MSSKHPKKRTRLTQYKGVEPKVEIRIVYIQPTPNPNKKAPRWEWLKGIGFIARWIGTGSTGTYILRHMSGYWEHFVRFIHHFF